MISAFLTIVFTVLAILFFIDLDIYFPQRIQSK